MTLAAGTRLGPYEIVGPLGAGGMGEVYRARDVQLDRAVAIKALPEVFAGDAERLARFEREARLLAALSHANIAGIFGLVESNGQRYLALELVEGETLAQRLARGALPVGEAVDVCVQIAAALDAAHEAGIVHRDLKPGNIILRSDGVVKVLDFGLAKGPSDLGPADLSQSPTMTHRATVPGMILGTAAYMSPEQARGKPVDRRTDIWSFGCVLYECLTGRQAFHGETVSDIVARILQGEPEWNAIPARAPERLRELLHRCLEKDARRRLRDIGDARIELEALAALRTTTGSIPVATAIPRSGRASNASLILPVVAVAIVSVLATRLLGGWMSPPTRGEPSRFEVSGPEQHFVANDPALIAMSPDGRTLAYVAFDSTGPGRIWLRSLGMLAPRMLAGTERAGILFWSTDGRSLAFFTDDGKLKKVAVAGGDPEVICAVKGARGGSWGKDGTILLAPTSNGPIDRVSSDGGEPEPVTAPDTAHGETAHRFPQFLPDGKHFLYTALPAHDGKFDTYIAALGTPGRERLLSAESGVRFVPPGQLLYTRGGRMVVQPFDADARRLRGAPVTLGDIPAITSFSGSPVVSASPSAIAFDTRIAPETRLAWFDLQAHETAAVPLPPGPFNALALSPDGQRAVVIRDNLDDTNDLWLVDLARGASSRLTDGVGRCGFPRWSPDGRRIAYTWEYNTPQRLVILSIENGAKRTLLAGDPAFKRLDSWSNDGRFIVLGRQDATTKWDLWIIPADGDTVARPYLRTPANEQSGIISPDSRWMSFESDESGHFDVYVTSFPVPGPKYAVTTDGGSNIQWSRDGKRLLFSRADEPYVGFGAPVLPGREFALGPARAEVRVPENVRSAQPTADARRLLILLDARRQRSQTITVVLDWRAALARR